MMADIFCLLLLYKGEHGVEMLTFICLGAFIRAAEVAEDLIALFRAKCSQAFRWVSRLMLLSACSLVDTRVYTTQLVPPRFTAAWPLAKEEKAVFAADVFCLVVCLVRVLDMENEKKKGWKVC